MFSLASQSFIFSSWWTFFNHLDAEAKVLPLSEKIFSSRPRLATKRFRLRKKYSVVWSGCRSKLTARVKLHANGRIYAFISLFFLLKYLINPAKSTPMDLKGTDPSVLSLGRFPVGGFARAVTWKRLHPGYSFITLFVSLLRRVIQYFSRIFAIVKLTPPWRVWRWACITSFLMNKASSGR